MINSQTTHWSSLPPSLSSSLPPFPVDHESHPVALNGLDINKYPESLSKRLKFFHPIRAILKNLNYLNDDSFFDLTEKTENLEKEYRTQATETPDYAWFNIKLMIIWQMGICLLRNRCNLSNEEVPTSPAELIPLLKDFDAKEYKNEIKNLFDETLDNCNGVDLYLKSHKSTKEDFLSIITSDKNKIDAYKCFARLSQKSLDTFKRDVNTFLRTVEDKVLPVHMDDTPLVTIIQDGTVRSVVVQETVAGMTEQEWTEEDKGRGGPYASEHIAVQYPRIQMYGGGGGTQVQEDLYMQEEGEGEEEEEQQQLNESPKDRDEGSDREDDLYLPVKKGKGRPKKATSIGRYQKGKGNGKGKSIKTATTTDNLAIRSTNKTPVPQPPPNKAGTPKKNAREKPPDSVTQLQVARYAHTVGSNAHTVGHIL